jgi:hypothetical protein
MTVILGLVDDWGVAFSKVRSGYWWMNNRSYDWEFVVKFFLDQEVYLLGPNDPPLDSRD